jgi:hypothetical protein
MKKNLFWKIVTLLFLIVLAIAVWDSSIQIIEKGDVVLRVNRLTKRIDATFPESDIGARWKRVDLSEKEIRKIEAIAFTAKVNGLLRELTEEERAKISEWEKANPQKFKELISGLGLEALIPSDEEKNKEDQGKIDDKSTGFKYDPNSYILPGSHLSADRVRKYINDKFPELNIQPKK